MRLSSAASIVSFGALLGHGQALTPYSCPTAPANTEYVSGCFPSPPDQLSGRLQAGLTAAIKIFLPAVTFPANSVAFSIKGELAESDDPKPCQICS